MTCSLCSNVAWYIAGRKGFCGDHRDEAYAAALKENRRAQSRQAIKWNEKGSYQTPKSIQYDRPQYGRTVVE